MSVNFIFFFFRKVGKPTRLILNSNNFAAIYGLKLKKKEFNLFQEKNNNTQNNTINSNLFLFILIIFNFKFLGIWQKDKKKKSHTETVYIWNISFYWLCSVTLFLFFFISNGVILFNFMWQVVQRSYLGNTIVGSI